MNSTRTQLVPVLVALSPAAAVVFVCAPATPNGQLPIMEVDGKVIPQSVAQIRYVGKVGGLYPTDPIEAALADAAIESVIDIHGPMRDSIQEKDDAKKVCGYIWCCKLSMQRVDYTVIPSVSRGEGIFFVFEQCPGGKSRLRGDPLFFGRTTPGGESTPWGGAKNMRIQPSFVLFTTTNLKKNDNSHMADRWTKNCNKPSWYTAVS